jgi:hypothetical protein
VIAQFVVVVAMSLFIANMFASHGARIILLVPCLLLWSNLYTLGLLNEGRPYAARFELVRLFLIVPIGVYGLDTSLLEKTPTVALIVVIYILVSALWLRKN